MPTTRKRRTWESGISIRARMALGMLMAAALLVPVVSIAVFYIREMNDAAGRIAGQDIELMQTSDRIPVAFLEARRSEKNFLLFRDSTYLVESRVHLDRIKELCDHGRTLAPEMAERFNIISTTTAAYAALTESLVRLTSNGLSQTPNLEALRRQHQRLLDAAAAAADTALRDSLLATASRIAAGINPPVASGRVGQALNDSMRILQDLLTAQTDSIALYARDQAYRHQQRARQLAAWGQRNIITASMVVLVVLIWLLVTLPRRAVLPIKRITNAVRRMEKGDLDVRVTLRTKDELGELARHLNLALARLREFDERKTSRIRYLERRFRLLSQDISEGVLIVDKVPNVVTANAAMEPLLGCPAADAVGRRLRSFSNLKFLYEPLESVLAGATGTQTCEIPAELPGSAVCIEAMRDKAGTVTGALVVVTNPTPPQPVTEEAAEVPAGS